MPNFSVTNSTLFTGAGNVQLGTTTTYRTNISINNSSTTLNTGNFSSTITALRRGKLYDIMVGTNGTPADNYMEWDVCRIGGGTASVTAGGVSSVSTSFYIDLSDAGGGSPQVIGINSSVETLFSSGNEIWYVGVNQRASYRWVAAPGSELVWPANSSATGNNGLAGRARSAAYTGNVTLNWLWTEM